MDPRQTPVGHSLNVSGEHHDRDAQLAAYSGHHDGDSGTTEHNETFSRESSCTLTAEDDEQADKQQAENEQAKSMPTTMEAESVALIDRIKNDPFHTPMLLSEAKRILDRQLESTEDKTLSFLDKDPTTAPFIYDMVHSMDMREDVFAFQEFTSHDMSRRKWYTVEAFSKPLSLAALFLAKHVTPDRKLPVEVMKKLQVREQREIARWVEHSGVFAGELARFEKGDGPLLPSKLFVHAGYDGYHNRQHYSVLKDPRPLVESGYEFDHGPSEPWGSIAHMITAYSKEAKRRSELVPAYPVVPEVAGNKINNDPSRAYVDVGDNATLAVEGETYWHEGRRWPPNVDANFSSPGRATDTDFEFLGEDKDAAFTDALLMNMLG
ncbi:hypothetical protein PG996_003161 [Apiospora saccharicola]|uniref:Uncharacterized protein n=1 Tax=Apiospora saccharicola TaxID=335842 RepID=A0ABR1W0G5_9PEZI